MEIKQSKHWDMNISVLDLIKHNKYCKVNRNYKAHKSDDGYGGYCVYLKHPDSDNYSIMITISEDGLCYDGDSSPHSELPFENTESVIQELLAYGTWLTLKEDNKLKVLQTGIDYDDVIRRNKL